MNKDEKRSIRTLNLRSNVFFTVLLILFTVIAVRVAAPTSLKYIIERYDRDFLPWDLLIDDISLNIIDAAIEIKSLSVVPEKGEPAVVAGIYFEISPWSLTKGVFNIVNLSWHKAYFPLEVRDDSQISFLKKNLYPLIQNKGEQKNQANSSSRELPLSLTFNISLKQSSIQFQFPNGTHTIFVPSLKLNGDINKKQEGKLELALRSSLGESQLNIDANFQYPENKLRLENDLILQADEFRPFLKLFYPKLGDVVAKIASSGNWIGKLQSNNWNLQGDQVLHGMVRSGFLEKTLVSVGRTTLSFKGDGYKNNFKIDSSLNVEELKIENESNRIEVEKANLPINLAEGTKGRLLYLSKGMVETVKVVDKVENTHIDLGQLLLEDIQILKNNDLKTLDFKILKFQDLIFHLDNRLAAKDKKVTLTFKKGQASIARNGKIKFSSTVGDYGTIESSQIPTAKGQHIKMVIKALDLTDLSGFMTQAIGYGIIQGQLDGNLDLAVNDNQSIKGNLNLLLRKLDLDYRNESGDPFEKSLGLPLETSLSLISDDNENLELNFPIEGSKDNPAFNLKILLSQQLGGFLLDQLSMAAVKALATELMPLMSQNLPMNPIMAYKLLKKGIRLVENFQLSPIKFDVETGMPTEKGQKQLEQLAVKLREKKNLTLNFCTEYPKSDGELMQANKKRASDNLRFIADYLIEQKGINASQVVTCLPKMARSQQDESSLISISL